MSMMSAPKPVSKTTLPRHDFLGIDEMSAKDIAAVLDLADHYVAQNRRRSQSALLKGRIMINLFLENSTRTRLSFEIAAKRLGADAVNMGADGSSIRKGESLDDTLRTINAMLPDLLVIRHAENGSAARAAQIMDCPVVNGGDGTNEHPTQGILDALALRRHFGRLEGLTVAICGDILHSRVAHSNVLLLEKMGATVRCAGPKELLPEGAHCTTDVETAIRDADAVMVLRIQKERMQKTLSMTDAEYFSAYGLDAARLGLAKKNAVVMHPGPMNRGVEIDAAIADDPARSLITTQVEMGVAARMAVLDLLTRSGRS